MATQSVRTPTVDDVQTQQVNIVANIVNNSQNTNVHTGSGNSVIHNRFHVTNFLNTDIKAKEVRTLYPFSAFTLTRVIRSQIFIREMITACEDV